MRSAACLLSLLVLCACNSESPGVVAARMEAQDDASCRSLVAQRGTARDPQAYPQCRQNLVSYRQLAMQEQAQQEASRQNAGDALIAAGRALCGIGGPSAGSGC